MSRLVLFIAALCILAPVTSFAQQGERPTLAVGDSWEYRNINKATNTGPKNTTTILRIDSDKVVIQGMAPNGATAELLETLEQNTLTDFRGTVFSPDSRVLSFPLSVGKTWDATRSSRSSNGDTAKYSFVAKVVAWEKVKVPAGEFMAFKIIEEGPYAATVGGRSGKGTASLTVWWAPEVKRTIKSEYSETDWGGRPYRDLRTVMLSYKLAAPRPTMP